MNIKDFAQPTLLSGKQYGTTVTIELDHSDTSIDEVMDGLLTIVRGLGYLDTTINGWIKEKAKDIYDTEHEIIKDAFAEDWFDTLRHNTDDTELPTECWCGSRERCDCISEPNDNDEYSDEDTNNYEDGYSATDEDMEECELNERQLKDYKGVYVEKPYFDWNDEELDWPQPNDKLKEAAQKYSEEFDENNEFDDYGMRKPKPKTTKKTKTK